MLQRVWLLALLAIVHADVYLHFPRGSNNRMDDGGRDRDNGGRLFNSRNNNRGGNNKGSGQEYFYEGSTLPFMWIENQGCGGDEVKCEVIIQMSCHGLQRDGYWTEETWTGTIPTDQSKCGPYYPNMWRDDFPEYNCSYDYRYGMHETYQSYQECWRRKRNFGLFNGAADLSTEGNSAVSTRQSKYWWQRFGYECPEERDYYPYWAPSQWMDVAILTMTPERCPAYRAESQNVKSRWVCVMKDEWHSRKNWWDRGYVPINEEECLDPQKRTPKENVVRNSQGEVINVGEWKEVPSHGIPAPYCGPYPGKNRPNQFGNIDGSGWPIFWNWTIPELSISDPLARERCVLRMRLNISSSELPGDNGWESTTSVGPGADYNHNPDTYNPSLWPTKVAIYEKYGLTYPEVADSFSTVKINNGSFGRGYVYRTTPNVDIFGSLVPSTGSGKPVYLQLAIYTESNFITEQDRTHTFSIRKLPSTAFKGRKIVNLGVLGKRGNIVQTYPGTEYDFVPGYLEIQTGDLIHIQWNGANTNPRGNAGEGPAGFDRHNMILMKRPNHMEAGMELPSQFTTFGHWGNSYPEDVNYKRLLDFDIKDAWKLAVPSLNSAYFDFGIRQVTAPANTVYHYLSTRNNNFSNRSQKAKIVVLPRAPGDEVSTLEASTLALTQERLDIGWARIYTPYNERLTNLQAIILEDAGTSDSATNWLKISPRFFSIADKGFFTLEMEYKWVPFAYGRVFWAESIGDRPHELKTDYDAWTWDGTGYARAKIPMGGYFVVKNVPNGSAIGGTFIALAGAIVLGVLAYKRFGCRCWNKTTDEGRENLIGASSINSSAPTSAPVTTS